MSTDTPRFRVGCSGYDYDHWRSSVYPTDLPRRCWFEHYARCFDTVEINSTFYRLPEAQTFEAWKERASPGFRYALKLSRYGTHLKHLKDPEPWVQAFVERAELLGAYLGPVLVQLPPNWDADPGRLNSFLDAAPRRLRWAVEVRDRRWLDRRIYQVLERHDAALVIHDLVADHPRMTTASWVYLRFPGPHPGRPYAGRYTSQALSGAARRIRRHLDAGRDVYAYFNNDEAGDAPRDARRLRRFVGRKGNRMAIG